MSVLFMPQAPTSISTSPAPGRGVATSLRYSSFSGPPCPVRSMAAIVSGTLTIVPFVRPHAGAAPRRPAGRRAIP